MRTPLVDTHCHLVRYDDPEGVLAEAEHARVVTIAVSETPAEFERQRALLPESRYLRLALGLHPLRAARARERDLARFLSLASGAEYIGEVGLDFSRDGKPTARRQLEVFERILQADVVNERVMTVHSRGAAIETVDRLCQVEARAILHWYSGSLAAADVALDAGHYFSFNPAMTRSRSGQRLLAAVPADRVLTETDGPYAKAGGRPARPTDVTRVLVWLARRWDASHREAAARVADNMRTLYDSTRRSAIG